VAWFDTDYLGIDQGPILLMAENYRSELIWKYMRRHPAIIRGLRRAGFPPSPAPKRFKNRPEGTPAASNAIPRAKAGRR
jgi:hypothetical protein